MKRFFNTLKLLLFILYLPAAAFSMVLEESFNTEKKANLLSGKKIGYYIGSFDPLHKSHEQIAEYLLNKEICDYILIYPSWGGDSYKIRTELGIRLEMLFSLFKDHPNIIVTKYNPKKLQNFFVNLEKITFYGVIGSDTALKLTPDKLASKIFMSGKEIGKGYESHTWGGNIAIPVDSFIVFKRADDDLSLLNGEIGGRPMTEFSINDSNISSTLVRDMVQNAENIDDLVDPKISKIIKQHGLYH